MTITDTTPRGRDESSRPRAVSLKVLGASALILWLTMAAGGLFVLQVNHDENVLTTSWQKSIRTQVTLLLPERWAFFTKSPRDEKLNAFVQTSTDTWEAAAGFPIAQPQHAFGLNRSVRASGIEIGLLQTANSSAIWTECSSAEGAEECITRADRAAPYGAVANPTPDPILCGKVALVGETPSPWAYAVIGQEAPAMRIALIDVSC